MNNTEYKLFIEIIDEMLTQRIKYSYQVISKYLATQPSYSVLMKLGNIMRVEILNLNFRKKMVQIESKTKAKNFWSEIDQDLHIICIRCTVNLESIKTVYKETTELQITISFTAACR